MSDQGFAEVQRSSRKESFDRPFRTTLNRLVYLVGLVCFVYLVVVVQLVSFVQPNKRARRDRPNRPNEQDRLAVDVIADVRR